MSNLQDPVCWHGRATGSWWALGRDGEGRDWLVEAASQAELGQALNRLAAAPSATPASGARAAYEEARSYRARYATGHERPHTLGPIISGSER
ncbi:hypothetical protein [Actinomadura formosensis]|uniref:hypothetical protein n=1 Tax=Actinomadura formosensis TaxID=60706 RepID=UPI003D9235E9